MQIVTMRRVHLLHRWLGISLGLFILLWFLSGLVMLFVEYPQLKPGERLEHEQALNLRLVKVNPGQAWASLNDPNSPESVRLSMLGMRPVYSFLQDKQRLAVWADSGQPVVVDPALAKQSARHFSGLHSINETTDLIDHDQWSISSSLNTHRPLYRTALHDAESTELYVSSRTGEVVLDTNRSERAWNWAGSVIHWVYFTPLRMAREVWRQVVMWIAGAGLLLAVLGLWLGIQRLRIRRRYSQGRHSPYHGWKYWHHTVGLAAGIFCITWLFSGWLSMTPFGWFSDRSLSAEEAGAWSGHVLSLEDMRLPVQSPSAGNKEISTKEIEWLAFAGRPYLLARSVEGETLVDASSGGKIPSFTADALIKQAMLLRPGTAIENTVWLTEGDAYFRQDKNRKVLRVTFADKQRTSYYIDEATARILGSQDSGSRVYRWLFNGLHRMDIPPLGDRLLARRIVIFTLSAGGILLTIAGLVLAWRRIRRSISTHV